VSRYQKGENQEGKTNLDLLEQETVSDKPYGHDASRIVVRPISNFKGLPFGQ